MKFAKLNVARQHLWATIVFFSSSSSSLFFAWQNLWGNRKKINLKCIILMWNCNPLLSLSLCFFCAAFLYLQSTFCAASALMNERIRPLRSPHSPSVATRDPFMYHTMTPPEKKKKKANKLRLFALLFYLTHHVYLSLFPLRILLNDTIFIAIL